MYSLTKHGSIRNAHRMCKEHDLKIIIMWGSEVCDGYLMRKGDCQEAERSLKKPPETFRRLKDKRVVFKGGKIVTVFHASVSEVRRILRWTDERCKNSGAKVLH